MTKINKQNLQYTQTQYTNPIHTKLGWLLGDLNDASDSLQSVFEAALIAAGGGTAGSGGAAVASAEFKSPDDFTATFATINTITLTDLTFTASSEQVKYILRIPASGDAEILVNGGNGVTMTISGSTLTIVGADNDLVVGDIYQVGIDSQKKAYDADTNSDLVSVVNPTPSYFTPDETIATAQALTTSEADLGAIIDVCTRRFISIKLQCDVNTSDDAVLTVYDVDEDGVEYEIDGISAKTLWTTGSTTTDFNRTYSVNVEGINKIQFKITCSSVGTAGLITAKINKQY